MTAPGGCPWTAVSRASWITITSGAAGSGSGRVAYAVATNTGRDARTGTMTIAGQTFTVTQDGAPKSCSYSISPSRRNIGAAGGAGAVTVKTPTGCDWTAQSHAGWITITLADSGSGGGTLAYAVAPNTSGVNRQGIVTIAGRTFTVKQAR